MSLLKTNEIQNYNGSSLTLTASTVSTSAQLNTGGNISVTGSLNVSDDSTTRTNLGLGTISTQDSDSITVTGGSVTGTEIDLKSSGTTIYKSDGTTAVLSESGGVVTLTADEANVGSNALVVDSSGNVGIGKIPSYKIDVDGEINLKSGFNLQWGSSDNYVSANSSVMLFGINGTERMRIDASGNVLVGTTSPTGAISRGIAIHFIPATGAGLELQGANTAGTYAAAIFRDGNGTDCGSIDINASGNTTAYTTSSDYRLKENITEITDGITRVKKLNPSRFNFIADPDRIVDGFIAHEVQGIVPEAVSGEKDAVNEDGKPEYQGVDYGRITPLLTAALKEAIEKIEMLEARIAVLEAK